MSHETVIYGFIEGATWRANSYRLLQERNLVTLSALPAEDSWPPLARSMFSSPDDKPLSSTQRDDLCAMGARVGPFISPELKLIHVRELRQPEGAVERADVEVLAVAAEAHQ
ncbi:MAG: hypothetical protein AAFX94_12335, partial [Myxococcota bacterium]